VVLDIAVVIGVIYRGELTCKRGVGCGGILRVGEGEGG